MDDFEFRERLALREHGGAGHFPETAAFFPQLWCTQGHFTRTIPSSRLASLRNHFVILLF